MFLLNPANNSAILRLLSLVSFFGAGAIGLPVPPLVQLVSPVNLTRDTTFSPVQSPAELAEGIRTLLRGKGQIDETAFPRKVFLFEGRKK